MRIFLLFSVLLSSIAIAAPKPPVLLGDAANPVDASGPGFAIPFEYTVPMGKAKNLALSAWNSNIEYVRLNDSPNNWPNRYKPWRLGDGVVGAVEFSSWTVLSLPGNGTLYDSGVAMNQPGTIAHPDSLVYVPNQGFTGRDSFSYQAFSRSAADSTAPATVELTVASVNNYPLPVGFPKPWGIDLEPPADPAEWPGSERAGFFYIDSDAANCDDDLDYGTPQTPRCSFVLNNASVPAGGKIVLADSNVPYRVKDAGSHRVHLNGTANAPAWIVGNETSATRPVITTAAGRDLASQLQLNGSYAIVSGVHLENLSISHRHSKEDAQVDDYIMLRHSEVANFSGRSGSAISLAGVSGMPRNAEQVAIFNVSVHDSGYRDPGVDEFDVHGMGFGACTDCTILDVVSYGNGGDSYQNLQHNDNERIKIGRLTGHSEGENCVDIKAQRGLWVMDSSCWDLRRVRWANGSTGNGQGFFQNDDDCSTAADCEQLGDVIFLNNRVWDTNGPGFESSISNGSHYIVGNRAFAMPDGSCINIENSNGHANQTSATHVYFNTLTNCGIGISARPNADVTRIVGNTIDASEINFWLLNRSNFTLLDRNYYTDPAATAYFQCCSNGSPIYHDGAAAWQQISTHDANSSFGIAPRFRSSLTGDVALSSDSGLTNAFSTAQINSLMPGIAEMLSILGVDSVPDWNGTMRFDGQSEDAGADEY
ncbi:MAG: hypothetical protein AB8B93_08530 [Pseudomonadales bacterium]